MGLASARRRSFTLLLVTLVLSQTRAPRAQTLSDADPVLAAMQDELNREQTGLVLPGFSKPYFIEYRLDDITTYEAVASFGALTREENGHQRIVRVTVRVGSYVADNSSARGEGVLQLAPTENNPQALRYALWIATDEAYKGALRELSAKQASLKRFQQQRTEHDFAEARTVKHGDPLHTLSLDREEWKRRLVDASGLFRTSAEIRELGGGHFAEKVQYSAASLRAVALNRYLVNTEGTETRTGYTGYSANMSVGTQADDGMRLARDNGSTAARADELESAAAFRQRAMDDLKSLSALRDAPLVAADDYHGPVLFSGDASSDVLNRLFVPNIEADRPEPGTTARTQGAYSSSLRARVLPAFLQVTDDPLTATFEDRHLLGAYEVDDEGVAAVPTDIVAGGKLENFVIGRAPVRDFPNSNGHGRAAVAQPAHARAGILIVKPMPETSPTGSQVAAGAASPPLSDAAMTARLLALAREQNRDVYAVETLADLAPRLLFLVHPDGTRTLVRGAVFDELDTRSLRSSVVAAGGTPYINNLLGPVPQTTIAPSLLFDDIGVKRAAEEQQKLPYYPPPPSQQTAGSR